MMVKHAELAALWKAEKPDQAAITAKQKELNALRDQMQEKRTAFILEARKIAPELGKGFGRGMGHGMAAAWVLAAAPWLAPAAAPAPAASGQVRILPAPLINLLMVRGFLTGPSPFFVFPAPRITPLHHPCRSTNLVSRGR